MFRNTALTALATAAAAVAFAAPAHAQEIIPPAQPSSPTGGTIVPPAQPSAPTGGGTIIPPAQPSSPTDGTITPPSQPGTPVESVGLGKVKVARSVHGYTYAVVAVNGNNVPAGQAVRINYLSNLRTFKPRTSASWAAQRGTVRLANGDQTSAANLTRTIKLAFRDKSVSQVRSQLKVVATGSTGAPIVQPVAG